MPKKKCLCHKHIGTLWNFTKHLHEPSGTSRGICTGNFNNLTKHLLRQKPSGTSQCLFTETFRNLTRYLPRNHLEPHHASSPIDPPAPHQVTGAETSGTSPCRT